VVLERPRIRYASVRCPAGERPSAQLLIEMVVGYIVDRYAADAATVQFRERDGRLEARFILSGGMA
jgi:hypothetical protein